MYKPRINRFGIALTDAALAGNVSMVQRLLAQSTDYTYIQDVDNSTALHEVVRRIMENFIVNDPSRYTFQVVNEIKGYFRVARILRDHINITHERHCQTPVSHVILNERPRWVLSEQVTITLLQSIATTQNLNYLLYTKEQLIDRLCFEFVSHSLTADNINLVDKEGNTALHLAVKIKQWDVVKDLLRRGADKKLRNKHGFAAVTLMHFPKSSDPENTAILKQLLSPQTVNIRGLEGNTLLHRATFTQSYDKVKLLLSFGAQVDIENERRVLPMHVALQDPSGNVRESNFFDPQLFDLLVPRGSNIAIYEGINMTYGLAGSSVGRKILETLINHLDPSASMAVEYSGPLGATKLKLYASSSTHAGLVLKNKFESLVGLTSLMMDTCLWIPLPKHDDIDQTMDNEEDLRQCKAVLEECHQERMKLTVMCSKMIHYTLWRSRGDARKLPLPNRLKEQFIDFAGKTLQNALNRSASIRDQAYLM